MKKSSLAVIIPYIILILCSFYLLLASRTKTGPIVWTNIHPWFMPTYIIATAFVAATIMSERETGLKLSFIIVHSVLSCLLFVIVFDGGFGWDTWVHLGHTRGVYDDVFYNARGLPWQFSIFRPAPILSKIYLCSRHVLQFSLSVIFARTFGVDVYWAHLLLAPLLWGIFMPVLSYSIAKILSEDERAAILSSFSVLLAAWLIPWAACSVPQSLGYIFFFLTLYLLLEYILHDKSLFLATISASASFLSIFITGIVAFALLLLAFTFKRFQVTQRRGMMNVELILAFFICVSLLPLSYSYERYFYPVSPYFTLSKLYQLSFQDAVWSVLLTPYEKFTLEQFVTYGGILELLGILVLVYYLFKPKKLNKQACLFLLAAYLIAAIDLRIVTWFMVDVPIRLEPCGILIAIPAAGVAISNLIHFLSPTQKLPMSVSRECTRMAKLRFLKTNIKRVVAILLIVLCLSGLAVASVYTAYAGGYIGVTGYELEAAKYIDETTPSKYIVLCDETFLFAGYAVVGIENPRAFYPFVYSMDVREIFTKLCLNPSPELMIEAARINGASFQYFVVSTRSYFVGSPPLTEIVKKASTYFEKYGVFGDGENMEVYVFRYRTPPLPSTSDVSAFYWDKPSSYIIQNDLMQILVPGNQSLEIRDLTGKVYEGIDFVGTSVDDSPLGNVSKVEYFVPYNETWIKWGASGEVCLSFTMKQQFKFRLVFNKVALVTVVERGKPFAQLCWESVDGFSHNVTCHLMTERYEQFLISGLTSAENIGSVHLRTYGAYYTVSRVENVNIHYAYDYGTYGSAIYPYKFKDSCQFTVSGGYVSYALFVDNDADFGRWVYIEMYLPDVIDGGSLPPFDYSIDNGKTWNSVYWGPLKIVNGTEVNWVVSLAKGWSEKPNKWLYFSDAIGGEPKLPDTFLDSGGCWNRIIFGMYLLGDTNPATETSFGRDEGDQALIRIGFARYGCPLTATYVFKDSDDVSYGLRNMNNVFLTFSTGIKSVGGVTFTKKLEALNITATMEDKIDHIKFDVPSNATFSLLAEFTESAVYESIARLSYIISETDNKILLSARVIAVNDLNQPAIVTICVPSNYNHDGERVLTERGLSLVLEVEVKDGNTETITIWPK